MFKLKPQYDRLVCIASIDTAKGKVRVNLGGTSVPSTLPATKYVPEKQITIPGVTQDQIKYLVNNKLAHGDKFQEVADVVKVDIANTGSTANKEGNK